MLAIVVSRADSASEHVGEHLLDLAEWTERVDEDRPDGDGGGTVYRTAGAELRTFDDVHLELDGAADAFRDVAGDDSGRETDPALLVFASRHSGETGPLLSAHHTGNVGPAEYGGSAGDLARACPNAQKRVLAALRERSPEAYEVGMECTHHGPSAVGAPSMFVELGSGEEEWLDPAGARAVAAAILELRDVAPDAPRESGADGDGRRHLVGFGGGHYAPRFERIVRETDWAVGHVAADWGLEAMGDPAESRDVLRRVFEESAATRAVVDGDYPDLEAAVEGLGYRVVSETWVRETTGVPLGLAGRLDDAICPVDEGLRFGRGVDDHEGEFAVVTLPAALLTEAQGIDADATRAAVERATLAFETANNGTRAEGRAAVPDRETVDALVTDLADVLRESYDAVELLADEVRARERAFDPERAATLGVPEGPKFGRLAAGESVEVDGQRIDPETVRVERERRFPIETVEE